jgi:cytochrome P450
MDTMDTVNGEDPTMLLFAPGAANEPHAAYRTLRNDHRVLRSVGYDGAMEVIVSRYEDVCWALRHPEVFSSSADAVSIGQEQPLIPLQIDPPDHSKYRRLLDPQFSPKRMAQLEGGAREFVNRLIDGFASRGSCDFHEEFATPLPSTIFIMLMGLPHDDLPIFLEWRDNTVRPDVKPGDFEGAQKIRERTGHEITEYFIRAIADRRKNPDDALLSRLVHAEMEGRPLTQEELLGTCHLLMLGGLDTVTATLDCSIAYLAHHPERRRELVESPERTAAAVEELLRFETPVQMVARVVKQDATIGGVEVKAGDRAIILIGAADGDEREFDDADVVSFTRPANRHVAFGGGPHRCLGSHLARLELRVALEEFHRRIPEYRVPDGTELVYSPGIRQTMGLPLEFEAENLQPSTAAAAGLA